MVDGFRSGMGLEWGLLTGGIKVSGRPAGAEGAGVPAAEKAPRVDQPRTQSPAAAGPGAAAAGPPADIGGLVRELAREPVVDSARVEELRLKIEAGRYAIEPERIAAAMIASELPGISRI